MPELDEDRNELIDMDEEFEASLITFLAEFEEKVWPAFQRRGYTRGEAMIIWELSEIRREVFQLVPHDE